ncbi:MULTISPECIES: hypothetical protein [unclassified Brenneria]|uniref:hypothetical protein n=1 Tax=unclassified Brenneria TaxID=2634434 RepID=UPI0029C2E85A|nr:MULTISPECIES: hypothetical protein [unclassified Brenneria]MDX5627064.1 hypothetical protein [Brenneria sp. L3-3Z]MDX5693586.1 hypothetical protein [Brenneria sp. L4-2C]MEE3663543.1 hypothetical protein [Brenneria sp. g21c3]
MDITVALVNPETVTAEMRELYEQHENHALSLIAARLRSLGYLVDLYDLRVDGLTENEIAELGKIPRDTYDEHVFISEFSSQLREINKKFRRLEL